MSGKLSLPAVLQALSCLIMDGVSIELVPHWFEAGCPAHQAQQQCWLEFGPEAFHQALQRFWLVQERGVHVWTLERYLDVLTDYRQRFATQRPRPLPLLVLARPSGRSICPPAVEVDGLFWLRPGLALAEPSMRHTCA